MEAKLLRLLMICSMILTIGCRRPFAFHFKTIHCEKNPKYIASLNCMITGKEPAPSMSIELTLARDVAKLTLDMLISLSKVPQGLVLLDVKKLNGCEFLANSSPLPILQIIRRQFEMYSNIPNKCPVAEGTSIQVHGMKLDPENFPNYVPETKFYVRVRIYENSEHVFNLTINGTCENTRKFYHGKGQKVAS